LRDTPCQTFCNGCFTDASFTHQQGVVFTAAAQNLNGSFNFIFTANQGVNLAVFGHLIQVLRELFQRGCLFTALASACSLFTFRCRGSVTAFGGFRWIALANAMCDEVHNIQTGDTLLVQVVNSMRIFFAKNGHQHVGAGHFLLTASSRLNMHDGALNHTLETQGRLRIDFFGTRYLRGVVLDK
jgi:hypothetical protein